MKGLGMGLALLAGVPEGVEADGKGAGPSVTLQAEHSDYTKGMGTKTLVTASARLPLGGYSALVLSAGRGERRVGEVSWRANGAGLALVHRIAPGVTSRTDLAGGKAGPLFSRLLLGEEVAYRRGTSEVRGGVRMARYAGGRQVRSLHGGVEQKVGPWRLNYSLAAYERTATMPRGITHRLSGAVEDRHGLTQWQLGTGSSLHEHDWRPEKVSGSFRSVALKRKHKLARGLAVELGSGWTAFERKSGRYGALKGSVGLILSR